MPQLVIEGTTRTNQTLLDHGITDLIVHDTGMGAVLYATSGPNGGLTAYAIGADGALQLLDYAHFHSSFSQGVMDRAMIVTTANGPQMVVAEGDAGQLTTYRLATDGRIDGLGAMTGVATLGGGVLDLDQWNSDMLFLASGGTGSIEGYAIAGPNQLSRQFTVTDPQATYATSVFRLETMSIGGADYLLGASIADRGVTAYRIAPGGLVATGNLGIAEGIGIMTPTALATTQIGSRHFVLLASAPSDGIGQSGAISVMELRPDGNLWPTDHVTDTLHTRFGMVQSLDVITANGFTYVVAAGGDDGLTLFVLMPNGRLQILDTIADRFDIGLENVTAIATVHTGGTMRLFASSETSAGVTELSLDTSRNGAVLTAQALGGQITGTALNDILVGGAGDEILSGGPGDDIIEDGAGRDTLTGGSGRDIFVLRSDGVMDLITDFEPGRDRIDLSDWPFLYDPTALSIQPTTTGAIVTWRGETLVIDTADGTSLTASAILAAILITPNRTPFFSDIWAPLDQVLMGTASPDHIIGGVGNDTLDGLSGNDTLDGESGHDSIFGSNGFDLLTGGDGNDWLDGGAQADKLYGGAGSDTLIGGLGNDRLFGGSDDDSLTGGDNADMLWGDAGDDTLTGDDGTDRLYGGSGKDDLYGGDGNDKLWGGAGFDVLHGGAGDDSLDGGAQADRLYGGDGNDTGRGGDGLDHIHGDDGNDLLYGGAGNDALWGGNDDDRLYGDAQSDRLWGQAGHDTLFGGAGFDMLDGGPGDDSLDGGDQADNLFGGAGHDTLIGGAGSDRLFGGTDPDQMFGGADHDALFGGWGNDTLDGGSGDDRLYGGAGNDLCLGGDGHDQIEAGSGFDTVDGGAGNDALWGGLNADTFVFADGHGIDTIHDFEANNRFEKIDLTGVSSITSIHDLLGANGAATQVGTAVRIDTGGGNLIWLMNTDLGDLDRSDFLL